MSQEKLVIAVSVLQSQRDLPKNHSYPSLNLLFASVSTRLPWAIITLLKSQESTFWTDCSTFSFSCVANCSNNEGLSFLYSPNTLAANCIIKGKLSLKWKAISVKTKVWLLGWKKTNSFKGEDPLKLKVLNPSNNKHSISSKKLFRLSCITWSIGSSGFFVSKPGAAQSLAFG